MSYIEDALREGQITVERSDRGVEYVRYVAANRRERWSDPEEKVRAEYYAELIHRYGYSPKRIGVEVTVPDRSPNDFADLVIFHDDERKRPFAVIECKAESYGGKGIFYSTGPTPRSWSGNARFSVNRANGCSHPT